MKRHCVVILMLFAASTVLAQPFGSLFLDGPPVNVASQMPVNWPSAGIAQGSVFRLTGGMLGPSSPVRAGFPLPIALGGTSVKVAVGDRSVFAYLLSVGYWEIIAMLPSNAPLGDGDVTVTREGESIAVPVRVVRRSFGIFTRNQGQGPAVAGNVAWDAAPAQNTLLEPAWPKQLLTIWGTGLGPVARVDTESLKPLPGEVETDGLEVLVGGWKANVLYAGRAECCAGIDEIVLEIPGNVAGCWVPIAVKWNEGVSNFATVSVAAESGRCPDPPLIAEDAHFEKLARGEALNLGRIELLRLNLTASANDASVDLTMDLGYGAFTRWGHDELFSSTSVQSFWRAGTPSPGYCSVLPLNSFTGLPLPPYEESVLGANRLHAGAALNITGLGGTKSLDRSNHVYLDFLGGTLPGYGSGPLFLEPGKVTVDNGGEGGPDVGAFQASVTIPVPMTWLNRDSVLGINRSEDLSLTWLTENPEKELITIVAASQGESGMGTVLLCAERASAGKFTIPAWVLSALLPSATSGGMPLGLIGVISSLQDAAGGFTAPGLDAAALQYVQAQVKTVPVQ